MKKPAVLAIIFFLNAVWADIPTPDPGKEEVKKNPFHATLGIEMPSAELTFQSSQTGQRVQFNPSLRGLLTFGFADARYFGVTAGIPIKQDDADKLKQGSTDYSDFRFNFARPKYFLQTGYTQYRGFFIQNSNEVDPAWSGGPYLRADDLYKRTIYLNATMINKPNRYSLESVIGQTARQKISGGSWLWGVAAREEKIDNSEPIIPSTIRSNFGLDQNVSSVVMRSAFIKGGYGYQHNFTESIFVNGYIMGGLGIKQLDLKGPSLSHKETETASKVDIQLSLINNGKKFYGGFRGLIDNATYDSRSFKIDSNFYTVTFLFGRRFH